MGFFSKLFGDPNSRAIGSFQPIVDRINALEPAFQNLSDGDLSKKTEEFRSRLANGETLDQLLPEAFAAVREAARRAIGQRHFDVQLLGGIALHRGAIAEMRTGEGKTLVATLPLYLNALAGNGAHLVTPNDYLSRVGAGWMGPVYARLGMTTGVIAHDFSGIYDASFTEAPSHGDDRLDHFRPVSRRDAYAADITYGTNNEFGFDYLRDNMAPDLDRVVQRAHYYAIVDEVDSILIDEARTPLIISAPDIEAADSYHTFARLTPALVESEDYNVDEKFKAVTITEAGIDKIEKLLGVANIYEEKGFRYVRYLEQALRAQALFKRDRDYVVKEGEVIIVDEFTGRLMPGRRWSDGLHQAIEAKEGVRVQQESRTLATITFQNYFRLYRKLGGMTGTAMTSAEEFHKVYRMEVMPIPTNRPMVREDRADLIFKTEHGKFSAIAREVKARHERGQPVLIGTVSIAKNERLAEYLRREGIAHQVLNAKNHEQEALIIAQAGRRGAVTIATNMAGRGVDIILGGNPPESREADEVRAAGGLHVIGTERHEARRIDNQLRGRAGRQGDPGSSQFFLSLEDDLMRIFGSDRIKSLMETLGIPEDQPIEHRLVSKSIESAQAKIEGFHFDARKHILEFDDVMTKQREYAYRLRRGVLEAAADSSGKLVADLFEMVHEEIERLVSFHAADDDAASWNITEIVESVRAMGATADTIAEELTRIAGQNLPATDRRAEMIRFLAETFRLLFETEEKRLGQAEARQIAKIVTLQSIDMLWMDHLDQMEHLRDSVRLRAYGQRDPLVEYKHEGVRLFRELQASIRAQIAATLFKALQSRQAPGVIRLAAADQPAHLEFHSAKDAEQAPAAVAVPKTRAGRARRAVAHASVPKKAPVGRNDLCPCGSGKKYKKCGDLSTEEHQRLMAVK
ncbi:preprotein translocase subunit SecA [Candidatus Parcubacteria bacterium]|nr:MAG: preprotein translocase subunit SecA [Candidatus Parcubacteria bacterium]